MSHQEVNITPTPAIGRALLQWVAPIFIFITATVLFTWPLVGNLHTHIPGADASDNVSFVWNWWWMRQAMGPDAELFTSEHLFFPFGTGLAMHTHGYLAGAFAATAFSSFDIVVATNLAILAALSLNGIVTFWLAFYTTRDWAAAVLAGLFFAWAPFFAGHVLGHFNLIQAWPLPLFALVWLHALQRRSLWATVGSGVVLGLAVWADYYFATYLLVFVVATLVSRWVNVRVKRTRATTRVALADYVLWSVVALLLAAVLAVRLTGGGVFYVSGVRISATTGLPMLTTSWLLGLILAWRRWPLGLSVRLRSEAGVGSDVWRTLVTGAVSAVVALPIVAEAWKLWRSGGYVTPPGFLRSAAGGLDPFALLIPSSFHPLWGDFAGRLYEFAAIAPVESTGWLGVVVLVAFIATRMFSSLSADARVWRVSAVVFFIWALGPYLRVLGENTGLYLPAAALRLLPVVDNVRIPGRAMVMVYLSLAVLLASAIAAVPAARRRTALFAASALIVADFARSHLPLTPIDRPALYEALAAMPRGGVIELPMGIRDGYGSFGALDHRSMVYQTIHGHPIAGGFVARMSEDLTRRHLESDLFGPLLSLSASEAPADDALARLRANPSALLRENGIAYVVVSRNAPTRLQEEITSWPLDLVAEDALRRLYGVRGPAQ